MNLSALSNGPVWECRPAPTKWVKVGDTLYSLAGVVRLEFREWEGQDGTTYNYVEAYSSRYIVAFSIALDSSPRKARRQWRDICFQLRAFTEAEANQ